MNGQTLSYKKRRQDIDKYVQSHDIYNPKLIKMDLRGYIEYIKEHNLSWDEIDAEISSKFISEDS